MGVNEVIAILVEEGEDASAPMAAERSPLLSRKPRRRAALPPPK